MDCCAVSEWRSRGEGFASLGFERRTLGRGRKKTEGRGAQFVMNMVGVDAQEMASQYFAVERCINQQPFIAQIGWVGLLCVRHRFSLDIRSAVSHYMLSRDAQRSTSPIAGQ